MQRLFVGTYWASISSPNDLTDLQRRQYAKSFLDALEARIGQLGKQHGLAIRFELLYAESGCIKLKAKVFVEWTALIAGGSLAAMFLLYFPAVQEHLNAKGDVVACSDGEASSQCKVLNCDLKLATAAYETQPGDSLDEVIRNVWRVPAQDHAKVANAILVMYPKILRNPDDQKKVTDRYATDRKLVPGRLVARIDPSMCRFGKR